MEMLVGPAPRFPVEIEENIDAYLRGGLAPKVVTRLANPTGMPGFGEDGTERCSAELVRVPAKICDPPAKQRPATYRSKQESGRLVFANE
jgi:hypothetical protein